MKKLLLLLFLAVAGTGIAQEINRDYYIEQINQGIQYKDYEKAALNLTALQHSFPLDDQTRFLEAAVTYFTTINNIKYREYLTIRGLINYMDQEVEYFKNTDRADRVLFMSTMLKFSISYYQGFKKNLSAAELKDLENEVYKDARELKGNVEGFETEIDRMIQTLNY